MSEPIRQALILAGGRGARLGAITEAIPKPMLRIAGDKPFLDTLIEMIERHGYEDILLLGGYLGEVLEAAYDGRRIGGATVRVLLEKVPLGTAGALTVARDALDSRFLMMNGDAFFDINLRALEQASREGGAVATLALRSVRDASRYGRVIEREGKVVAFLEKDPTRPGPGIINGGIYVLKREILDRVSALPCSLEQDVFPTLVERGQIRGKEFDGYFLDIGLPETLEQGHRELPETRKRPAAFFDRRALVGGGEGDAFPRAALEWRKGAVEAIRALNDRGYYVFSRTADADRAHTQAARTRRYRPRSRPRARMSTGSTARPALGQAPRPVMRGVRPGRPTRSPKPWANGRSCAKNPSSLASPTAILKRRERLESRARRLTAAIWRGSSVGSWRDPRRPSQSPFAAARRPASAPIALRNASTFAPISAFLACRSSGVELQQSFQLRQRVLIRVALGEGRANRLILEPCLHLLVKLLHFRGQVRDFPPHHIRPPLFTGQPGSRVSRAAASSIAFFAAWRRKPDRV